MTMGESNNVLGDISPKDDKKQNRTPSVKSSASNAEQDESTKLALRKQNSDTRRIQIYSVLEDDGEARETSPRPET